MKKEFIRGNKEHWKEVCEYVYGFILPPNSSFGICGDDRAIFVRNKVGEFTLYTDEIVVDAITTNPNWHEIKPWEKHYEPKPFDKVLGWNYNENAVCPDIFLHCNKIGEYLCARNCFKHVKPYNEEEYLKSSEWYYGKK